MLLDTSAWIEYFKGSERGRKVKSALDNKGAVYTCPLTIAEISGWCHKNDEDPSIYLRKIKQLSKILELSEEILVISGKFYHEERKKKDKIGMIDCIIYITSRIHSLILITSDNDFRDLVDVDML